MISLEDGVSLALNNEIVDSSSIHVSNFDNMSKSVHTAEGRALTGETQEEDSQLVAAKVYERMKWAEENVNISQSKSCILHLQG